MQLIDYRNIIREAEALVVRPAKEADFAAILKGLQGQVAQKNKYDEEELELTAQYTKAFCIENIKSLEKSAEDDKGYLFRIFKKKNDGGYIGGVIIKTIKRQHFQWAEVGYWLLNQHWGNGYGVEVVEAAIDIAFKELGFHRLEAHINLDNIASQKKPQDVLAWNLNVLEKGLSMKIICGRII